MISICTFVLCASYCLLPKVSAASDRVIVGFYKDWTSPHMSPTQIPFSKYTHINYAFAILDADYLPVFETENLLNQVVEQAHANKVKVLLSIGGWSGSNFFSKMVASPERRKNVINKLSVLKDLHTLDGFDIDWEYPGRLGNDCNVFNVKSDAKNLLKLLTEMRLAFPKKLLTLTVRVEPFDGPNGPMKDASEFAKLVDFINIMAYDINGSWSETTAPNAPMRYESGKGLPFSFKQSINSWLSANFPPRKIVIGIPFYGRSLIASVDMTEDPKNMYVAKSKIIPQGDKDDAPLYDACSGRKEYSGIWGYRNLRLQNVLSTPTTAGAGWTRYWDKKSQTPWLFNPSTKQFITYDDGESIEMKVKYTLERGLKGVMVWSMHQDNGELIEVLQRVRNE